MKTKIFGYKGGTFSKQEVEKAKEKSQPLTLDMAIKCDCLLSCEYCGYYDTQKGEKLSSEEIKKVIYEFTLLGGKSIKFLGEGEPILREDIFDLCEYAKIQGQHIVIFDSGNEIGEDTLAKEIHGMASEQIIDKLSELDVTMMIKYDKKEQDKVVRSAGYSERRKKTLELLMKKGFNEHQPSHLGFGIVILNEAYEEIPKNYEFALENNIYPLLCPLMPCGKAKDKKFREKIGITQEQIVDLTARLNIIAQDKGIKIEKPADFPGGLTCDISRAGFYVADTGNIYICESDGKVGNVRDMCLIEAWVKIQEIREKRYKTIDWYEPGVCFAKRKIGILPQRFDELVLKRMEEYKIGSGK